MSWDGFAHIELSPPYWSLSLHAYAEMLAPHQISLHCLALVCTFGIICIGRCCADWLIERTLDPCASQTAIYKLQCCITPHTSYINATEAQKLSTQKFLCKDCLSGCQQIISLSSNIILIILIILILIMDGAELSWEHCLNQSMLECQIGKDGRTPGRVGITMVLEPTSPL